MQIHSVLQTTGPATIRRLVDNATLRLLAAGVRSPGLDAEVLLAQALGTDRTALHRQPARVVGEKESAAFENMLQRRCERVPLAYIVGRKEFWSLDFEVTPDVLIPRPETERIIELALGLVRENGAAQQARARLLSDRPRICDMGTGSGCIAVTLARELPAASIVAADISAAALAVAERNARRHGVRERVEPVQSDLFASLSGCHFDLVVSNPPYVAAGEIGGLEPELRCEPEVALVGGADGLEVIRRLVAACARHLTAGGWLLVEVAAARAAVVADLARAGGLNEVRVVADYAGLPRLVMARAG